MIAQRPTPPPGSKERSRAHNTGVVTAAAASGAAAPGSAVRRPMAQRGSRALRKAREFSWRSPEAMAIMVASFVVSLACLYVNAYARVTAEGFEAARLGRQVVAAEEERLALTAQISNLNRPEVVEEAARRLGLVPSEPKTLRLIDNSAEGTTIGDTTTATLSTTAVKPNGDSRNNQIR